MPAGARFDIAVVGASLAGCAAAILLGRAGARVALIERSPDPHAYKRACTHAIQSSANGVIERLGLREAMAAAGAVRSVPELGTRWGWIRPPLQEGGEPRHGLNTNLRREKLDPLIRGVAAETPGVELMQGLTAVSLIARGGRASGVVVQDRAGARTGIEADLVIGADGRDSAVARFAGLAERVRENGRFCFFAYYRDLPLDPPGASLFWIVEPEMHVAYALPNDEGLTLLVALPVEDERERWRSDPEGSLAAFYRRLDRVPDPAGGELASPLIGRLDLANVFRRPVTAGVALVGDAATAVDPAVGVGCGWALQSAGWLADALAAHDGIDSALHAYSRCHREELAGHASLIAEGSQARPFGNAEALVYRAATRDPVLAERIHGYSTRNLGARTLFEPRTLVRATTSTLRRRPRA